MRRLWFSGSLIEDVMLLLEATPDDGRAVVFERAVRDGLKKLGFTVRQNVIVPNRGDGFRGKVDIVAERGNERAAIELDAATPREKSIFKVKQVTGATLRLVYCRRHTDSTVKIKLTKQHEHTKDRSPRNNASMGARTTE